MLRLTDIEQKKCMSHVGAEYFFMSPFLDISRIKKKLIQLYRQRNYSRDVREMIMNKIRLHK